jgi:hypothetical protein
MVEFLCAQDWLRDLRVAVGGGYCQIGHRFLKPFLLELSSAEKRMEEALEGSGGCSEVTHLTLAPCC